MNNIDDKILLLLKSSTVNKDIKDYIIDVLDKLDEKQKNKLLDILNYEKEIVQSEIEKEKNNIFKELLIQIKLLAKDFKKKYLNKLEETEIIKEKQMMESLENQLNEL